MGCRKVRKNLDGTCFGSLLPWRSESLASYSFLPNRPLFRHQRSHLP